MGQRDSFHQPDQPVDGLEGFNYETRELAWELTQPRIDSSRIRFLIETGADLVHAMHLANLNAQQLLKNPQLRPLQLQRLLTA